MEPTSDLFDGDLLGDELIDIYNAAVVGSSDDDAMNEIPSLLAPVSHSEAKSLCDYDPNPQVSHIGSTVDDGLGAFRPSTSFNDLSTLLPPSADNVDDSQRLAPVVPSSSMEAEGTDTKRPHSGDAALDAPAAKRRALGLQKKNATGTPPKGKGSKTGATAKVTRVISSGKQSNNTPNPLTTMAQPAVAAPSGTKNQVIKPIEKPNPPPLASTAVVTPRAAIKVEDTVPDIASTSSSAAPTEADFKSVAQAAVSNLIMNVGTKAEGGKKSSNSDKDAFSEKVDTSTEHIKALTGTNWVAVCEGGGSSNASVDKGNNRARRQNLTPDERARQNRDRNREHARNTRLRKKAYVEELKRTLTALVSQRDSAELEKRHTAQRDLEQREVRFRVVEEFLKLRGRNELNYARWSAILEDSFTMTLPNTDFREMVESERGPFEQKIAGVAQAMADSKLFSNFLQGLGRVSNAESLISFAYECDRKNFFMDNCTAVLNWTAVSVGAVQQGAPAELALQGNISAKFSPASNKLISVALNFDTGIILSQMNHTFKYGHSDIDDVDAAQVAASEADAILDSLQMPHIATSVPPNVNVVPASAVSITDGEKSDSSDESNGDADDNDQSSITRMAFRA